MYTTYEESRYSWEGLLILAVFNFFPVFSIFSLKMRCRIFKKWWNKERKLKEKGRENPMLGYRRAN